ncbi:hypothetical protein [Limimaricola litoreus]|uniref:hypothetical protein n=1 Tax=Limimaricola litoreus TaxID=2955316 RepID=UPI0020A04EE3|nr:hypothetical protein [Limimaricola litoreus]
MQYVLDDGLVVLLPRSRQGSGLAFALAFALVVLLPILAALGAKSFLFARLDVHAMAELLGRLEAMGAPGRALGWLMQPEPVTATLAPMLAGLLG